MTPDAPPPSVFVMGAGVVGTALAAWLVRAAVPLVGLHGRQVPLAGVQVPEGVVSSKGEIPAVVSDADVVIIAARDERIPAVAGRLAGEGKLRSSQVVLHTSGAHAARHILAAAAPHVAAVGTLHPLVSFSDPRLAIELEGPGAVAFGLEGDEPARAAARRIVGAVGARAVVLEAGNMALYHAGAVMASNCVVALADVARTLLVTAGVPPADALPALIPLLSSVVQNLAAVGLPGALTGPVERGDVSTVERHLAALTAQAPDAVELYRRLGRDVLRLARDKGKLEPEAAARLAAIFKGPSLR
jgi:predicted short-subunit dehydrogenase-like oxidoreductase (DUF2520 family)